LSRDEVERLLCHDSTQGQVQGLRGSLFAEAVGKGLADTGDRLVMRRKVGGGKTVKEKYAEDIWALMGAIQRNVKVSRTLLRNGKRAKDWLNSQTRMRGQERKSGESDVRG